MHIMSLALGGCIKGPPVNYGLTEDTGGHIAYILGEMAALARHPKVESAEIVTRLFEAPELGASYAKPVEVLPSGVTITRIDSGNRRYLAKEALAHDRSAFVRALIAELRNRPRMPDLIHAHFADAADVACQIRAELGIPFVYTAHSLAIDKRDAMAGSEAMGLKQRIAEEQRAIDCADAIVASSRDECERQLLRYDRVDPTTIHRLRPGVAIPDGQPDLKPARALIAPFLREPGLPIVLAIARPVHKKNLVALVEAFGQNPALRSQANLVILAGLRRGLASGEDEQRAVLAELTDAIDRHNLYGSVAYPPRHTQDDVQSLYALASKTGGVFVNPALTEPYGLTLVEAAAHGLPVVSTRNGGPNDIVADLGHGTLVDPMDTGAIASAVLAFLDDEEAWKTASTNGRTRCRSMSWDAYADGFVELALEITDSQPHQLFASAPRELLVCDIDNTLTGCRDGAQRLARYVQRRDGMSFCVATGRSLVEARRILREWHLPRPRVLITSVGSEIYWQTGSGLEADVDFARHIEADWQPDEVTRVLDGLDGLTPQPGVEQRRWKRSYFAVGNDVTAQVERRLEDAGLKAKVIFSHGELLDVLPIRAGKGAAMRHVAKKAGIAPEAVVAVGDSGNDLDMLRECRNAVLVSNYGEDLRDLVQDPGVYVARRAHAGGVLEGHLSHTRRRRRAGEAARSAA